MIDRRTFALLAAGSVFTRGGIATTSTPASAASLLSWRDSSLALPGGAVKYRVRLEQIVIPGQSGPESRLVALSYARPMASRLARGRPVCFAFNGGPGASSAYLHLMALGPRRINLPSDPSIPIRPPYTWAANQLTPLTDADLVFVDPVGTGLSRLIDPSKLDQYYSVDGDGRYIADFIRLWLADNQRVDSPVYLVGESYGCMRAVAIAKHLTGDGDVGVKLAGLVLLSESIGVLETVQRRPNIVGYAVGLETLAATAWFHKRAQSAGLALEPFLAMAREFATNAYLPALYSGRRLSAERRNEIANQLSRFSGLSARTWVEHDLQITKEEYRTLLFVDQGLVTGLYDTRYLGPESGGDPALNGLDEALQWGIRSILKDELSMSDTEAYQLFDRHPPARWTYAPVSIAPTSGEDQRALDYPADLMETMQRRSQLRVFVCGGYFDTAASVGADEYLLRRNQFPTDRVLLRHYIGGHMFYTDDDSRAKFLHELNAFIKGHA